MMQNGTIYRLHCEGRVLDVEFPMFTAAREAAQEIANRRWVTVEVVRLTQYRETTVKPQARCGLRFGRTVEGSDLMMSQVCGLPKGHAENCAEV